MKHICKIILVVLTLSLSAFTVNAQIKPIGNNADDTVLAACNWNNELYFLTGRINVDYTSNPVQEVKLCRLNNSGISVEKKISFYGPRAFYKMLEYKNQLYIMGRFDSIENVNDVHDIIMWDGKKLNTLNGGTKAKNWDIHISDAKVYNGELVVIGGFFQVGDTLARNIASWDGTNWKNIYPNNNRIFQSLAIANGALYTLEVLNKKLWKLDNTGWNSSDFTGMFLWQWQNNFLREYKDSIVITVDAYLKIDSIFLGKFNSFKQIDGDFYKYKWKYVKFNDMLEFNGELWASGWFIDQNDDTCNLLKWNGTAWKKYPLKVKGSSSSWGAHKVYLQSTNTELYAYGYFDIANGKNVNFIGLLTKYATISGKVYHDRNSNCIYNTSEKLFSNSIVELTPGPHYTNTDDSGNYEFYVDSGAYTINVLSKKHFKQACPANNAAINISVQIGSIFTGNDFGFAPTDSINDIRLTLDGSTGFRARQGFTESYALCYENIGTTVAGGKITLKLDSAFSNFSSIPSPVVYSYPFAEWNFSNLLLGEKRCITFKARLDSATTKDSVMLFAGFNGGDNWIDTSVYDNFDSLQQRVVGSLDPNDKQCNPAGDITKFTKDIRYHIRFQNTGTDTAYRVFVIDTIDVNLPLTKIMMNSTSHKYKLDIKDNVFKWTFDNILLPDSTTNEPLSHGYISYTAQIKPGLAVGTEIKNTAHIYFDYQKPVVTNQTRNKMTEHVGVKKENSQSISSTLQIYPNPASDHLTVKNGGKDTKQLHIVNMLGQTVDVVTVHPFNVKIIDVQHFKKGIYFIYVAGEPAKKIIIE